MKLSAKWLPFFAIVPYSIVHNQAVVLDNRRITSNSRLVSYQSALVLLGQMVGLEQAKIIYERLSMDRLGH